MPANGLVFVSFSTLFPKQVRLFSTAVLAVKSFPAVNGGPHKQRREP
jgi:hypothetical protein